MKIANQDERNERYGVILKYLISVIVQCISVMTGIYQMFPKNLIIKFT